MKNNLFISTLLILLTACTPQVNSPTKNTINSLEEEEEEESLTQPGTNTTNSPEEEEEEESLTQAGTNTTNSPEEEEESLTQPGPNKTIRFLHYNDLHAHLVEHTELVINKKGKRMIAKRGGIARLKTLVDQLRSEVSDSVFMNIGDTYHGGVEATYSNGNAIVTPVNELGIDIGVPGNWDFAYGPAVTRLRYTYAPLSPSMQMMAPADEVLKPNFINLAANVTYEANRFNNRNGLTGKTMLPATHIMNKGSIKIGFIGITSDMVPRMHSMLTMGLSFLETEQEYINLINSHSLNLKSQGANVIVVMSELSIHKDLNLANKINTGAVDVFFSAHTHEATFEPLQSRSGAIVVEAGSDAYLGVMDFKFDSQNRVMEKNWQLLEIKPSIAENQRIKTLVENERAPFLEKNINMPLPSFFGTKVLDQPINKVIGHTSNPLDRKHALESTFNNAFTDLLKERGQTEAALSPGFRFDNPIAAFGSEVEDNVVITGNITIEDLYRFFPVTFSLATGKVTGSRLKEIIEDNLEKVFTTDIHQQSGGWFDGWSGLEMSLNLKDQKGQRVKEIYAGSKYITDSSIISVTGCRRPMDAEDVLCSYSGFTEVKAILNSSGEEISNIDLLEEAFASGAHFNERKSINDLSGTEFWPLNPFVQPIEGAK